MQIELSKEDRTLAVNSIKHYFMENTGEEIGDLKAMLLLDFFLEEIAPSVYNRAIQDARSFIMDRAEDLPGTCYMEEFGYWQK